MKAPRLGRKMIKPMGGKLYTVTRSAAGKYYDGVWEDQPPNRSPRVPFDATEAEIQTALREIKGLEGVTVEGTFDATGITITFPDNGKQALVEIPVNTTGENFTVTATQEGDENTPEIQTVVPDAAPEAGYLVFEFGEVAAVQVLASVQPLTGDEIARIPEGDRKRERRKAYSADLLHSGSDENQAAPDVVTVDGVKFQVESVEPWLGHWKAILVKIEPGEVEPEA